MDFDIVNKKYLKKLLSGDRLGCREVLSEALKTGTPVKVIYEDMFWPVMAEIEKQYRANEIDVITQSMATRINRTLVDQLQSKLPRRKPRDKKMIITCAAAESEELGAQMCADLFESDGWEVKFLGGSIPNDEILGLVGTEQPDILFVYGARPTDTPGVRQLIDLVHRVGACPKIRFMVSGGIFNRAEGLAEEIGVDLFASTVKEALAIVLTDQRNEEAAKKRVKKSAEKAKKAKVSIPEPVLA